MTSAHLRFRSAFHELPLVAILRGISAAEADGVADVLVEEGFRLIEVPLNSPDPFTSIKALSRRYGEAVMIGAGTVRKEEELDRLVDVGACLMVTPHADVRLIAAAKSRGMAIMPGVGTPTEGFAALDAGADGLKVFPSGAVPPDLFRQWRSVFPSDVALCPTGGIGPEDMEAYVDVGASGFGLGTGLYRPGLEVAEVRLLAQAYTSAWRELRFSGP